MRKSLSFCFAVFFLYFLSVGVFSHHRMQTLKYLHVEIFEVLEPSVVALSSLEGLMKQDQFMDWEETESRVANLEDLSNRWKKTSDLELFKDFKQSLQLFKRSTPRWQHDSMQNYLREARKSTSLIRELLADLENGEDLEKILGSVQKSIEPFLTEESQEAKKTFQDAWLSFVEKVESLKEAPVLKERLQVHNRLLGEALYFREKRSKDPVDIKLVQKPLKTLLLSQQEQVRARHLKLRARSLAMKFFVKAYAAFGFLLTLFLGWYLVQQTQRRKEEEEGSKSKLS